MTLIHPSTCEASSISRDDRREDLLPGDGVQCVGMLLGLGLDGVGALFQRFVGPDRTEVFPGMLGLLGAGQA